MELVDLVIRQGDILTLNAKDYPVKFIETWKSEFTRGSSFKRLATERVTISREIASGKNYNRETIFENLPCMPLDPLTKDIENRVASSTPFKLLQTFINSSTGYYRIVVEDLVK